MNQRPRTKTDEQRTNDDVVVSVKNVSKKFCKNLKRSMAYGIVDLSKNLLGIKPNSTELRKGEFWAVDDISFELRRGEVLGLIGVNGSGKTTLLRLLAGIFPPDKGEISIKGRVGALVAVGAGFHPYMTGRENIYLNGTILGMSREEINSKFQDIVDFAEIGDFLDAPVSTYSSGMRVRLGFSIAVQIDPDVMLIDEVLAVGDVGFRGKCFNAIERICNNAAVIFVSHQMPQISRVCTDIFVMNHGDVVYKGRDVPKGIGYYSASFETTKTIITGSGRATIHNIELRSNGKKRIQQINYLDNLSVHLNISVAQDVIHPIVGITFLSPELHMIAQCVSSYNNIELSNSGIPLHIILKLPAVNLNPGVYLLSVFIYDDKQRELLIHYFAIKEFQVSGNFVGSAPVQLVAKWDIKH